MKRLALLLCVAVMTIGSITTVFAQKSVDVDSVVDIIEAKDKDGNYIEIRMRALLSSQEELAAEAIKPANLKAIIGDDYNKYIQVVQKVDIYIWHSEKGEIPYEEAKDLFPITVTFNVPGVTEKSKVILLHYYDGAWNVESNITQGKNTVTAKLNRLSPFIFLVDNSEVNASSTEGGSGNGNSSGNGGETTGTQNNEIISPKTGMNDMVICAAFVALAGFAGVVVSYKKKRA